MKKDDPFDKAIAFTFYCLGVFCVLTGASLVVMALS